MDLTMLSYEIAKYALSYNLLLFLIWLIMVRRDGGNISEVYLLVMCLFGTRLYSIFMVIRVRELKVIDGSEWHDFLNSVWWDFRTTPETIVFIVLALLLTRRFVKSYLYRDPKYRVKNGKRKSDTPEL